MKNMRKILANLSKEHGIDITRAGFYLTGRKQGFIVDTENGLELDEDKLKEWIDKVNCRVPKNYVTIEQAANALGLSKCFVYTLVKGLSPRRFGRRQVLHYKFDEVKAIFNKYRADREISWRV